MNMFKIILTSMLFAIGLKIAGGANILAIFPHTGKSHFFMFEPFIVQLAERGHRITLISHYPIRKQSENVDFINLEITADRLLFNSLSLGDDSFLSSYSKLTTLETLNRWGLRACDTALSHPPIQKLIELKPSFDLVLVEFFNTDCFSIFSHIFNAPLAGIFSSAPMPWHYDRFGNPDNPSYIVNHFLGYPSEMNLPQRIVNTMTTFSVKFYYRMFFNWATDSVIRRHLGSGLPSVEEIVKNTSLFLVNAHFSLFQARPLVPGIIEVGGLHVIPARKLPRKLEEYLEKSPNGVVYFSLGSTVLGYSLPDDKRKAFAEAFRKISLNVIWKWENETMPDKPENVLIQKWVPQNDLLAHPKVKIFVTHSGLMGTEEAVYHGVPLLMIPLFGDQPINAASCAEKGLGIIIDFHSINEETVLGALKMLLEDKRYSENAKYVSKTFRDRPISVMDNAIYWIEYVIRYKGAPHLRSAAIRLPWYSEYLLDVLFVIASVFFGFLYVARVIMTKCRRGKGKKRTGKSKEE